MAKHRKRPDLTVHTQYGSYNPVTGEGLPLPGAPPEFMLEMLRRELDEGLESGIDEEFDFDKFLKEMRSR